MLIPILGVVVLLLCLYIYNRQVKEIVNFVKEFNALPRKKGYPILGNVLEFMGTPDEVYRQICNYVKENSEKGVSAVWIGLFPLVWITEPDIIGRILTSQLHQKGIIYDVLRPWLNDGLLVTGGEKWHRRRKLLTPAFHFNVLQKFLQIFNEGSKSVVESIREHTDSEVDVSALMNKLSLDTICETAMGTKLSEQLEEGHSYRQAVQDFGILAMKRIYRSWLLVPFIFRLTQSYWELVDLVKSLHGFTEKVIQSRKKNLSFDDKFNESSEDFLGSSKKKMAMLDLLISAQLSGEDIDDKGIREEVDTFVFEGYDTTSASLASTLMLLANNRQCQERIYDELTNIFGDDDRDPTHVDSQEMKYLECCIKESLRMYPSVPQISRTLGEDIILDSGCIIPKGCVVVIMIYELHRRPDLFPNPEKFNPDRFLVEKAQANHPYAYVPFSAGSRNCIGQKFAMMEMKCILSAILRNYILEPVDAPEDVEIMAGLITITKNPIRVKFLARTNR